MTKASPEYFCQYGHLLKKGIAEVWYCACFGGFYIRYKYDRVWGNKKITLESLRHGFKPPTEEAISAMLRAQIRYLLKVQVDKLDKE